MGLERRLIVDRPPSIEAETLRKEVSRLVDIYGADSRLREGAERLLTALARRAAVDAGITPSGEEGDRLTLAERLDTGRPFGFEEAMQLWLLQGNPAPPAETARRRFELAHPNGITFSFESRSEDLLGWYVGTNPTVALHLFDARAAERWPDPTQVPIDALEPVFGQAREPLLVAQAGGG
jgi:hypothetical protein